MSNFPNNQDDTYRSNSNAESSHQNDDKSAPLQNALQAWEIEVRTRLSTLRESAAELEAAEAKQKEARKKYRNLYQKAETDGIIKTIGKSALRDAGIPTPITRRRKRKNSAKNDGDMNKNSSTLE